MRNGCILCGGTGSGKSRTAIAYYAKNIGTQVPIYIITTARKRDTGEWFDEFSAVDISCDLTVNSWNNIQKYICVTNAFFIFDEQRVVGRGVWVQAFLKIVKSNRWILLSATPGDCWQDYVPVFIANGFYRNRTDFNNQHIVWARFSKYPKVDRYLNTGKLNKLRDMILVDMPCQRSTVQHHIDILVQYDRVMYKDLARNRWNYWLNKPIETASEFCYALRKLVNSDESREIEVLNITEKAPKAIIFYNFDYELDILKSIAYHPGTEIAEWNGHKHQPIPDSKRWVYLVQYSAGCEAWNCITTDTIIFYSQNYSYKVMEQASGRIDRLNTRFVDLYYYHLKSRAPIDRAISMAIEQKKIFNERKFNERKVAQ